MDDHETRSKLARIKAAPFAQAMTLFREAINTAYEAGRSGVDSEELDVNEYDIFD